MPSDDPLTPSMRTFVIPTDQTQSAGSERWITFTLKVSALIFNNVHSTACSHLDSVKDDPC